MGPKMISTVVMTHNKHAHEIEKYIAEELSENELREFSEEVSRNSALFNDVKLFMEIDSAIAECDIIEMRHNLNCICKGRTPDIGAISQFDIIKSYDNNTSNVSSRKKATAIS